MKRNTSYTKLSENEILEGLKVNLRFYPFPYTDAFHKLSVVDQKLALAYHTEEALRTERLEKKYLKSV
jgi:hypothetical protein